VNDRPVYRHVQTGMWMRIFMLVLAGVLLIPGSVVLGTGDLGLSALALGIPLLVVVGAYVFSTLTIEVTASEVRWWFGFGWPGGRIERADLVAEEIANPSLLSGIGIHLTFTGWLWNVKLGTAVALHRNGRLATMLGTDDPSGLLDALASGASPFETPPSAAPQGDTA
jgi:hypothetical protein